ncbi:DUF1441 family protein [Yersinia ruckeri]|uniref:DUF1441 family protein n=1 Tax=Yersinia ruckeri TaxID=29486 RepID=UPI001F389CF2|nr:DUF1441 family protein [Yersinia ruckeri]UIN00033.1 DUF1441 family protein [Yersinia ruckeri]
MSNISNIGDVYHWSIAKIAEAFRLDRKVVKKRLLEANIPIAGEFRGNAIYALSDVGPALFGPQAVDEDIQARQDPNKMDPKDRKDWFDSEKGRIWLEKELRHLIPHNEVISVYSSIAKSALQVLETLPDRLERDAALSPAAVLVTQSIIDSVRDDLALKTYQECAIAQNFIESCEDGHGEI